MPTLILVKHSHPEIIPGVPANAWHLSAEGQRRCAPLADALAPYAPTVILSSTEPKAAETARLVAERLGLPVKGAEGLHEHDRTDLPFLSADDFQAAVARFFAEPGRLVMGGETADEAQARFAAAVAAVLAAHPAEETVVIVAHGTVIALFVAAVAGLDGRALWQRLGLPAFVVLDRETMAVRTVVERVV